MTKEQEEELNKKIQEDETKTIYICQECNERLVGMIEVEKHYDENSHYTYLNPETHLCIGFL